MGTGRVFARFCTLDAVPQTADLTAFLKIILLVLTLSLNRPKLLTHVSIVSLRQNIGPLLFWVRYQVLMEASMKTTVLWNSATSSLITDSWVAQSVQCLATGWTTRRSRFDPQQMRKDFSSSLCSDWLWRPRSLLYSGYRGFFPGGKARPGSDADHSPTSSAEVENE
jgi:hypothetical protein